MTTVPCSATGSEAMEAAIKLCRQYFLELPTPQPKRVKFIARRESWHGATMGALAMSGHVARRALFEPMLSRDMCRVSFCHAYRAKAEGESDEDYVRRLAQELDDEFQRQGPETVCAFVAEPVVGASLGCVPAVPGYFQAMRAVCDKYGALLVLDEVMCGMGRTGTLHAWEQEGVVPDIQTLGKGLGAGYMPIAALLINAKVADTLKRGSGAFSHGQTYQGHPLACAAALEVQRVIREEGLVANSAKMGKLLGERLKSRLGGHAHVGDIRGRGLFWGIEFVKDKATKEPFDPKLGVSMGINEKGLTEPYSICLYPGSGTVDGRRGDHVLLSPPFTVTEADVETIVERTARVVEDFFSELRQ
ncbi:hypothetical protein, variant [Verruconis gallopava]|uniref:Aminotransferase n=1 Tax=Verruconis gallopava TaxID=253628 RepID=A0A0D1XQH6_9PEZI|nr:hypothetical protein, variant [Verruconis gallopava]KIW04881.1 hypothetical protein, variant [Verruconis gallopava]